MNIKPIYQRKPTFINLNIASNCNYKCLHCPIGQDTFIDEKQEDPVLDIGNLKNHALGLKRWLKDFKLVIGGGEPFLYPHLFEFIEFCNKNKILVDMITNGSFLTEDIIKKLSRLEINHFLVSIDGLGKTHDFIRQKKGSFNKIITGLKKLHKLNPKQRINSNFTIMSYNAVELKEYLEWFNKQVFFYEANFQAISLYLLRKNISNYENDPLWPKIDMTEPINEIIKLKNKNYAITNSVKQLESMKAYFRDPIKACSISENSCPVQYTTYFIEPNGQVLNCPMEMMTHYGEIGNLNQDSEKIWKSKKAEFVKEKVANCKQACHVYFNCCYEDKNLVKYPKYGVIQLTNTNLVNHFKGTAVSSINLIYYSRLSKFLANYITKIYFYCDFNKLKSNHIDIIKQFID